MQHFQDTTVDQNHAISWQINLKLSKNGFYDLIKDVLYDYTYSIGLDK